MQRKDVTHFFLRFSYCSSYILSSFSLLLIVSSRCQISSFSYFTSRPLMWVCASLMHTCSSLSCPFLALALGYPEEVSCRRRALGWGGTRTDSLIVVVNCCHTEGLRDPTCVMFLGFPLHAVYWVESPRHSQIWVMTCSLSQLVVMKVS
jgi:hypothetical protein